MGLVQRLLLLSPSCCVDEGPQAVLLSHEQKPGSDLVPDDHRASA